MGNLVSFSNLKMSKTHGIETGKGPRKYLDFWKKSLENTLLTVNKALNYQMLF